jgi:alanyl-tRNA synthetase
MQQHSGQHLLTAITQERLGLATSSFHLGETQSHIDLDGPPMEAAALRELEEAANGKISDAVPIRPRIVLPEDLEALGVRSSGLPLGHHGDVRLIEIEGLDLNTCGGTHVSNTAELGVIQLLSCARIKTGSRLHFLVGGRVRQALRTARAHEQKLNRLLQGGPETHLTRIEKLLSGEKSAARALKNLRLELATAQAIALAQASGPLVHHHQPGGDMNHLRSLASAALRADDPRVLLLTASDASGQGIFLLAGEAEGVARLGPAAAEAMGGRGGGAGGRYQGKAKHTDISSDLIRQLETLLRS